jgi:hypothetical protein
MKLSQLKLTAAKKPTLASEEHRRRSKVIRRLHEQIVPHNSEFFEKINSEFGLDSPPRLL